MRLVEVDGTVTVDGDAGILDHPDGVRRVWTAVHCPNAGDVVISATEGWEFADMGGSHHQGGGSHGSLTAADSIVPVIAVGLDLPRSIVDVAPTIVGHLTADWSVAPTPRQASA